MRQKEEVRPVTNLHNFVSARHGNRADFKRFAEAAHRARGFAAAGS